MKKIDREINHVVFQPTFGNRPNQYIGRDRVIEQFIMGLQEPIGSRNRCSLFLRTLGTVPFGTVLKKSAKRNCP